MHKETIQNFLVFAGTPLLLSTMALSGCISSGTMASRIASETSLQKSSTLPKTEEELKILIGQTVLEALFIFQNHIDQRLQKSNSFLPDTEKSRDIS